MFFGYSLEEIVTMTKDVLDPLMDTPVGSVLALITENILIFLAVAGVFGIFLCFFGLRLLKFTVSCCGAGGGAWLGLFVTNFLAEKGIPMPEFVPWIVMAVVGLIGMALALKLSKLGIVVAVAFLLVTLVSPLVPASILTQLSTAFNFTVTADMVGVVVGLIGGLLSLIFVNPAIRFCTAVGGGVLCGGAIVGALVHFEIIQKLPLAPEILVYVLAGAFAIFGLIVQFKRKKSD